jgi:serine/threonine protein kinase
MADKENNPHVAVKELTAAQWLTPEEFHQLAKNESTILTRFQNQSHPHLIRVIAYYIQGKQHFFIFPWAREGNLRDFWRRNPNASLNFSPEDWIACLNWFFRQLIGLSDAIKTLHHPKENPSENCRHGDLKPENILCFSKQGRNPESIPTGVDLVVADAGLAKVHEKATEFRVERTKALGGTTMYSPPESEIQADEARTRRYDVWSLGCLYLEFLIWLLYGNEALDNFHNAIGHDQPYYEKSPIVRVRSVVEECINAIKDDPRCSPAGETALGRLADLIENRFLVTKVVIRRSDSFSPGNNTGQTDIPVPSSNTDTPMVLVTRPTIRLTPDENSDPQRADAIEMHHEIKKIFVAAQGGSLKWISWNGLEEAANLGPPPILSRPSSRSRLGSAGGKNQNDPTPGVRYNVPIRGMPNSH